MEQVFGEIVSKSRPAYSFLAGIARLAAAIPRVLILGALLVALFNGLVAGVIIRAKTIQRDLGIEPPLLTMPGNRLPPEASCNSYIVQSNVASCNLQVGDKFVYMSYNPFQQAIIETVMKPAATTVGDVVVGWGTPIGYRRIGKGVQIFWPGRSIYTASDQFTPLAPVESLSYVPRIIEHYLAWRGFTNVDHESNIAQ